MQVSATRYLPTGRNRQREFSRVRQNCRLYNLNSSLTHSNSSKEFSVEMKNNTNKARKQPNDMNSRTLTSSQIKLLCVGCFNYQMHEARKRKHQRQKTQQSLRDRQAILIQDSDNQYNSTKYYQLYEYRNMGNQNKRQIMEHMNRRDEEKRDRQRMAKIAEEERMENIYRQQQRCRINQLQKDRFKQDLDNQIQLKRMKLAEEERQKKQPIQLPSNQPTRNRLQQKMGQQYHKQLLQQIESAKRKKKQHEKEEILANQQRRMEIDNEIQQGLRVMQQECQRKRNQWMVEKQRRRTEKEEQKRYEFARKQQQLRQRRATQEYQKELQKKKTLDKQNVINCYMNQLQKQLQANESRKRERKLQSRKTFISKKQYEELVRQCDSCEKIYPERYLTSVRSPLEI